MNKVCHLSSVHKSYDTRIFYKECVSLTSRYDVHFIVSNKMKEERNGVHIIPFKNFRNRIFRILFSPVLMFIDALKIRADLYHIHDPELLPLAFLLKIFLRSKIIYDVHEDYKAAIMQKEYLHPMVSKIIGTLFRMYELIVIKLFVDATIIAEKYYREFIEKGIEILNFPVLLEIPDKKSYSSNDKLNLLYTGGVTLDRGALIHSRIPEYYPNCVVTYIGKCTEQMSNMLKAQPAYKKGKLILNVKKVYMNRQIIDQAYLSKVYCAGLALFPFTEHYHKKELTKFYEYMNAGLPIIASNFPVWENLINENQCGICVDPENENEIISAIDYLLKNHRILSRNGKKNVTKYSWKSEEKKLLALYSDLLRH